MDIFMEYLINRKKDAKDIVIISGIVCATFLLTIVLLLALMMFSQVPMVGSIGMLLVVGVWWGAYQLISRRNIEWEYILTNSEFDIDKIMAKKGRKRVLSIDFKEANLVARIDDTAHNYEFSGNQTSKNIKVMDFTGGKNIGETYFIDIVIENERKFVLFQPTSKMLDAIKKFNPRNVFVME